MDINKLTKAQQELEAIREFCKENNHLTYDELFDKIWNRIQKLKTYAQENSIPLVVSVHDIVSDFVREDDYYEESSYYEEEQYSSYYEEPEDSYYEEEETSYYEDPADSTY